MSRLREAWVPGPGDVVADRFHIEAIAGQGGMGTVFRARDAATSGTVALKVVEVDFSARFEREATLLATLQHPGIVRYITHGRTPDGRMYLAMDWLGGLPLDERLRSGPLTCPESIALGTTLARALGAAHAAGIVHRDVKPSNVLLRGGDPRDAVLVDFGIARSGKATRALTATGAVIGTPGYMAPEQARAERTVDARADVFSLGCVLFECLCGRPPFVGEHVIAVLAKILFEPAPRLRSLRADAPALLDAVVDSMLQKSPHERPRSGDAVAERLEAFASGPAETATPLSLRTAAASAHGATAIGVAERRFATVLLARSRESKDALGHAATEAALPSRGSEESVVLEAASAAGLSIVRLADGMFGGVEVAADAGPDAAQRAARCALSLATRMPEISVALATGRAIVADQVPVGDAIDRAAHLLAESSSSIRIDEATASLIEARFELERDPAHGPIALVRERDLAERTIMGRFVPFVGRERELALLEATFKECVDEPIARATIVIAPLGTGKTRLQRELVARLSSPARSEVAFNVWYGFADPMMEHAPLAFVGDVLRRTFGLTEDEPLAKRREKILARVRAAAGDEVRHPDRVACFLGEIAGVPFDDVGDPILREARRSPELLASQLDDAFVAFVNGELHSSPIVLVLEDVHWADAASLRLLSTLLSRSEDRPLMLLALGRPGLDQAHPKLWGELRSQRLVLEPLLRKASERLARAVLGDRPEVDAIVQRAEGNALFVEELARACAEGRALDDLPATIAAATEARLAALDADARHALRAAAVFGERFWPSGVAKLLGRAAAEIEALVMRLEGLEVVSRTPESRFVGQREYMFRHALVRDAAYAMLTDEDRRLGHRLAAEWLEAFGVGDDMADVLALHFSQAGLWARAASHGRKAAERAIRLSRFSEGLALLERSKAWLERVEDDASRRAALIDVLLEQERVADLVSDRDRQVVVLDELLSLLVRGRDDAELATVHTRYGELLALSGRPDEAVRSLDLALELSRTAQDLGRQRMALKGMAFLAWQQGRYSDAIAHSERVLELARLLKEPGYGRDLVNLGMSLVRVGEMERARACLDEAAAWQDDNPRDKVHALKLRSLFFSKLGDIDAEIASYREAITLQDEHGLWPYKLISLDALAGALCRQGREGEGLAAYAELASLARRIEFKPQLARALDRHGERLVALGRIPEALPLFEESIEVWTKLGEHEAASNAAQSAARASRGLPDKSVALRCYERAADVARRACDRKREADLSNTLGILHHNAANLERSLEAYERALGLFESLGDRVHCALLQNSMGATLHKMGQHGRARERLAIGLQAARETGERLLEGHALALIGDAHRAEGAAARATECYEASLRIRRDLGDPRGEGWMLQKIAALRLAAGDVDRARSLRDEALRCAQSCGDTELSALCAEML